MDASHASQGRTPPEPPRASDLTPSDELARIARVVRTPAKRVDAITQESSSDDDLREVRS